MNRLSNVRPACSKGVSLGVFCLLASQLLIAQAPVLQNTLLPEPSQITAVSGSIAFTKDFTLSLGGAHNRILDEAARRTLDSLETYTGVQLSKELQASNATLTLQVQDATGTRPTLDTDESYSFNSTNSAIVLRAKTVFGAMHGLQTLQQLLQVEDGHYVIPAVQINDSPRFPWRGLMIDVSRHFMPLPVIYRTLDGMAAVLTGKRT